MFHLPFGSTIRIVKRDDGTLRLLDVTGTPFEGSRTTGKRGAQSAEYPAEVRSALDAWLASAKRADVAAALEAGYIELPVTVTTGKVGAPFAQGPTAADLLAALPEDDAPATAPATRSRK